MFSGWLEERVESVYKADPGYSDKAAPLFVLELGAPADLPDSMRGEAWAFVQLPLSTLSEVGKWYLPLRPASSCIGCWSKCQDVCGREKRTALLLKCWKDLRLAVHLLLHNGRIRCVLNAVPTCASVVLAALTVRVCPQIQHAGSAGAGQRRTWQGVWSQHAAGRLGRC